MKFKSFMMALLVLPVTLLAGQELGFRSPYLESPHFRILFRFEVKKDNTQIDKVDLNGGEVTHFIVYQAGKVQNISSPLKKGVYDFVVDYGWKSGKKYAVSVFTMQGEKQKAAKKTIKGVSPGDGGIPGGKEGFYKTFIVEEEVGLERNGEIVYLTITAPEEEFEAENLLILDGDTPIEYQVLVSRMSFPPERVFQTMPITKTVKIALPLDVLPLEKKILLVLNNDQKISREKGFKMTGEGLGKTVTNEKVSLAFHSQSGQINTIEYLKEGIKLWNEAGPIHWNPGCYIPGIAWDHSFNWNPPGFFEERSGPFIYVNSRKGPLPKIRDIYLEVKYTLESDSPYFISETRLRVDNDLGVVALRNDEMVLYKELFDEFIYKNKDGEIVQKELKEIEGAPYGLVHVTSDDLDWVGLLNTEKKFGFFSLRLNYANTSLDVSGNFLHKAGTYFYAPSDDSYVYWVRPLIYTWAEYTTNNFLTFVPKGSSYYEKNAHIILPITPDLTERLDTLLKRLRNPLRVF